jgi:hypothetical protein
MSSDEMLPFAEWIKNRKRSLRSSIARDEELARWSAEQGYEYASILAADWARTCAATLAAYEADENAGMEEYERDKARLEELARDEGD